MIVLIVLGYILLILLYSVIALALMVLFIPFSYASYGSYYEGDGRVTVKLDWIFRAIGLRFSYQFDEGQEFELRVGFLHKKLNFLTKPSNKVKELEDISNKKDKKKKSSRFTKEKLVVILKSLKKILMRYKPRRLIIDALIGFEDSYYTGLMCAGLSAISPLVNRTGNDVRVIPQFNDTVYEGRYETEGRVVVFFLAWEALKIYFSKAFRIKK